MTIICLSKLKSALSRDWIVADDLCRITGYSRNGLRFAISNLRIEGWIIEKEQFYSNEKNAPGVRTHYRISPYSRSSQLSEDLYPCRRPVSAFQVCYHARQCYWHRQLGECVAGSRYEEAKNAEIKLFKIHSERNSQNIQHNATRIRFA